MTVMEKIISHADEHVPGSKMTCPNAQGMCVAPKNSAPTVVYVKPSCKFAVWLTSSGDPTAGPFVGDMLFYSKDGSFIEKKSYV